jgi:hypothetical protein
MFTPYKLSVFCLFIMFVGIEGHAQSPSKNKGTMVTEFITSEILKENSVGLDLRRTIKIYLPPGYAKSGKSYPVVYYCHSIFHNPDKVMEERNLIGLLEESFDQKVLKELILVMADYSSATTGSIYENTKTTGRWLDYTVDEVVPFIDSHYRTLAQPASRALVGDVMGGRGVFMLAMTHPEIFSVAYALNPVATALGVLPMPAYPKWDKIHDAKSFADLNDEHISQIFVTVSQAYLPNTTRPPFYCDFLMEKNESGKFELHAEHAKKLMDGFMVSRQVEKHFRNLARLRALAFDWSRYDPIQDHVYGSQSLSRTLDSFGITHEAEEYRGVYWEENWKANGRFYTRVLPFLNRHLEFDSGK